MTLAQFGHIATMGGITASRRTAIGLLVVLHLAAIAIVARTEYGWFGPIMFVLAWLLMNLLFLALTRRPAISAALPLLMIAGVVVMSQLKFSVLWMVINFFDVLIIDSDTMSFLLSVFPDLRVPVFAGVVIVIAGLVMVWRVDPFRVSRLPALAGATACAAVITTLALAVPEEPWEQFQGVNHVSTFVRSGVTTAYELSTKGWIDFDTATSDRLRAAIDEPCRLSGKPPNIIMVLDEASFDARAVPGIKLPAGYGSHFQSFDGRTRSLLVDGYCGPTWYTEKKVLTRLSARSYGRLSY
jgi:hypothetical protein